MASQVFQTRSKIEIKFYFFIALIPFIKKSFGFFDLDFIYETKSFTSQCIILSMMAVWFSQNHNINQNKRFQYIKDLRQLSEDIQKTINMRLC